MATPPQLRQLSTADYPEAPPWFRRFLSQMSPFTAQVTDALGGQLGAENLRKQVETVRLKTRAVLLDTFEGGRVRLKNRLGVKPTEVRIARVVPESIDGTEDSIGAPFWTLVAGGDVRIDYVPGLRVSSEYTLVFVIE